MLLIKELAKYVDRRLSCTFNSSIKMRVSGHFEARVRHQETGDVGEARVDVFPHVLQLFVLVLRDLHHKHDHMCSRCS